MYLVSLAVLVIVAPEQSGDCGRTFTAEERIGELRKSPAWESPERRLVATKENQIAALELEIEGVENSTPAPGRKASQHRKIRELKAKLDTLRGELRSARAAAMEKIPILEMKLGSVGWFSQATKVETSRGMAALPHVFEVREILSPEEMIVTPLTFEGETLSNPIPHYGLPVRIRGLRTAGLADNQHLRLPLLFRVCGTMKNTGETLFVVEYFPIPKISDDDPNPPEVTTHYTG